MPTVKANKNLHKNTSPHAIKAIILAAGMGKRMQSMTKDLPKCLAIHFNGKTLLDIQLETLQSCGIQPTAIVRGYMANKINLPNIEYFENDDYADNNIMESLFYAKDALNGHVLVSYSDIWFDAHVVNRLCQSEKDITIAIDTDWKKSYEDRRDHPISEAESVVFDEHHNLRKIGKIAMQETVNAEFIGMMKLTPKGCGLLTQHYLSAKKTFSGKSFQNSPLFHQAYLTDLLQEMVDQGVSIYCQNVGNRWREIDTVEDFKKCSQLFGRQKNGPTL